MIEGANENERLITPKSSLEDRLAVLEENPQVWVDKRKQELNDALRQVGKKYEPEREGNTTMYNHLRGLLEEIAREEREGVAPEKLTAVKERRGRLKYGIAQRQARIDDLESDE